jgi:hypothetical protein
MGGIVLGRDEILDTVEALALSGETVLIYGPLGIGKTAILGELAHRAECAGRPCGICPRTERLADVTEALVRGYSTGTGALARASVSSAWIVASNPCASRRWIWARVTAFDWGLDLSAFWGPAPAEWRRRSTLAPGAPAEPGMRRVMIGWKQGGQG